MIFSILVTSTSTPPYLAPLARDCPEVYPVGEVQTDHALLLAVSQLHVGRTLWKHTANHLEHHCSRNVKRTAYSATGFIVFIQKENHDIRGFFYYIFEG